MDLVGEISGLATRNLSPDKFLVEVLIIGKKLPTRILVIIDGDQGISIDDCAALSRKLTKDFEDRGLFADDDYTLEVSTPGLDHPLKFKRQFKKNVGRRLKVKTVDSETEGLLKEVTDEKITLQLESGSGKHKKVKDLDIPFNDISKAFVMVSFK